MATVRLFAGIPVPDAQRSALAALQAGVPGTRWIPVENFHVTLAFIGEVTEDVADDAHAALESVLSAPFEMTVEGVGCFSQGINPTVLWAGISPSSALMTLQSRVQSALDRAGVPFERRKYTPHITLARFRDPAEDRLAGFLAQHHGLRLSPFTVDHFILYESLQTKAGSVYEAVAAYRLR